MGGCKGMLHTHLPTGLPRLGFLEPARLSTHQTLVFTKTTGHHNLVEVIVI